jgi:hypothetical protein
MLLNVAMSFPLSALMLHTSLSSRSVRLENSSLYLLSASCCSTYLPHNVNRKVVVNQMPHNKCKAGE